MANLPVIRSCSRRDHAHVDHRADARPGTRDLPRDDRRGQIARRFVDLERLARQVPIVVERVPPFSFQPALDIIDTGNQVLVEVAVPGIQLDDVTVTCTGLALAVSGTRGGERAANGRRYHHAEIPRGPFHRVVPLPCSVAEEARVDVERGLIRIRLNKAPTAKLERPSDRDEANNLQGD